MNDTPKHYLIFTVEGDGLGPEGISIDGPFDTLEEANRVASELSVREQNCIPKRKIDLSKPPKLTIEVAKVISAETLQLKLSLETVKSDAN